MKLVQFVDVSVSCRYVYKCRIFSYRCCDFRPILGQKFRFWELL